MNSVFPSTLPVKDLDRHHPDYDLHTEAWRDIDLLVKGGHELRASADLLLKRRPKELGDVFQARKERFTYQNIIGTGLGWYQGALFNTPPEVSTEPANEWCPAFLKDCNRGGKSYIEFWRNIALGLMKFRTMFVLADLPGVPDEISSLEEQRLTGALDPYLVAYDPRQVINWECDDYGNLEWLVIATKEVCSGFGKASEVEDCWYYFDRQNFARYEAKRAEGGAKAEVAVLEASGPHALAEHNRVPVRMVQLPGELWLADRAYLQALCHLNADNAYDWALFMSCLPVPIIKGDYVQPPSISETAFIQLAENGAFEWAEPSGTSFAHTAARIASLREEIYRQMYLQAQARDASATASAQSGISKQADMMPAREVMSSIGDLLRAGMTSTLQDVALIRGDDVQVTVRGFDFDQDSPEETADDEAVLGLGIQSPTFRREIHKRVARRKLRDAQPDLIAMVESEIDAAPDPQQQQREQQAALFRGRLTPPVPQEQPPVQ